MTQPGWVHMHTTSKRIQQESPGYSGFEGSRKILKSWATGIQFVLKLCACEPNLHFCICHFFRHRYMNTMNCLFVRSSSEDDEDSREVPSSRQETPEDPERSGLDLFDQSSSNSDRWEVWACGRRSAGVGDFFFWQNSRNEKCAASKTRSAPLKDQTYEPNWTTIWQGPSRGIQLRGLRIRIESIFEILSISRDTA